MCTPRASASTSNGCAYSRSIRSRTRRSRARSRRCCVAALVTCEIVPRGAGVAGVPPYSAFALARSAPLTSPTCSGPEVDTVLGPDRTQPADPPPESPYLLTASHLCGRVLRTMADGRGEPHLQRWGDEDLGAVGAVGAPSAVGWSFDPEPV